MSVVAIIQARTHSTRLPKKVLLIINNKTLLDLVIERVKRAQMVDKIIVATTTLIDDDPICEIATRADITFFFLAAKSFVAEHIVRITSDCPLISPNVIDHVIEEYFKSQADYCLALARENHPQAFPRGTNAEIFSYRAIKEIESLTRHSPEFREHVTTYFENHPEKYKIHWVKAP
jgi:spore coat polysaccharide biosynthesis protein SpsF